MGKSHRVAFKQRVILTYQVSGRPISVLILLLYLSLAISCCQGDVAGQQPKGNRIQHGKVKTKCLTQLSLTHTWHTHTHTSSSEPWARCCKSPEILLDFWFLSVSRLPDSLPCLYPSQAFHFFQLLVIQLRNQFYLLKRHGSQLNVLRGYIQRCGGVSVLGLTFSGHILQRQSPQPFIQLLFLEL